jgi:hypothetical protein
MNPEFNGPAELIVTRSFTTSSNAPTLFWRKTENCLTVSQFFRKPLRGYDRRGSGQRIYRISGNRMIITHTEVPDVFRGKGVCRTISCVRSEIARKEGLEVVAECDYANRVLNRL